MTGAPILGMLLMFSMFDCNVGEIRTFVAPEYPWMAHLAQIQGEAVVKLTIDADGRVASVQEQSGHPLLLREAHTNSLQWAFAPGMPKEQAIIYEFKISGDPVAERPIPKIRADFCHGRVLVVVPPIVPNIDVQKVKSEKKSEKQYHRFGIGGRRP
jgi:TonB family protein